MSRHLIYLVLCWSVLGAALLSAGELPNNGWQVLTVAYPDGRDVTVRLGGTTKTLTAKGVGKVKWREKNADVEVQLENLPTPTELGWTGRQYVLWAVDNEKHAVNLGVVPLHGKEAKWKLAVPLRIFGLLVTAEQNPQATSPSTAVVLESLLPMDTKLVVPVFKISLTLNQSPS